MAEKETVSMFNRASDVIKTLYTVVEQQKRSENDIRTTRAEVWAEIAEVRENVRGLPEHGLETERRIGTLEAQFKNVEALAKERHDALLKSVDEQRSTLDAKIQAAKAEMNAELQKAKLEMSAELQRAKAEMTAEFYKAKWEALTDLDREYNKRAADLFREVIELKYAAVALRQTAIEPAKPNSKD